MTAINKPLRNVIVTLLTILLITVASVTDYALTQRDAHVTNHDWCAALRILTKTPVATPADPGKNPSREAGYRLYLDFKTVENQFGC